MSYNSDMSPPRVFSTVTSAGIQDQADFLGYLMQQELARRIAQGLPPMTDMEQTEFKRNLLRELIVKQNPMGAINLRPSTPPKQLNG